MATFSSLAMLLLHVPGSLFARAQFVADGSLRVRAAKVAVTLTARLLPIPILGMLNDTYAPFSTQLKPVAEGRRL